MEKKTKRFAISAGILILISIILSTAIDIKIIMMTLFLLLILDSYIIFKEKVGQELTIAILFGLCITSYYSYIYRGLNIFIGKINLFPLISWTTGLVLLREIYERIKVRNRIAKFLIISLIYWALLFLFEFVGYNYMNIQLDSNFLGLFNLELMHAPLFLQIIYLSAGPIYLLITDYLKVK